MINILTTNNCVQCEYTKKRLAQKGVDYREINVDGNEAVRELLVKTGLTQMPVVMWSGFKIDAISALASVT